MSRLLRSGLLILVAVSLYGCAAVQVKQAAAKIAVVEEPQHHGDDAAYCSEYIEKILLPEIAKYYQEKCMGRVAPQVCSDRNDLTCPQDMTGFCSIIMRVQIKRAWQSCLKVQEWDREYESYYGADEEDET